MHRHTSQSATPLQTHQTISIHSDPLFAKNTPQPNAFIQQKIVGLGVNYFGSFKGQKSEIYF